MCNDRTNMGWLIFFASKFIAFAYNLKADHRYIVIFQWYLLCKKKLQWRFFLIQHCAKGVYPICFPVKDQHECQSPPQGHWVMCLSFNQVDFLSHKSLFQSLKLRSHRDPCTYAEAFKDIKKSEFFFHHVRKKEFMWLSIHIVAFLEHFEERFSTKK